MSDGEHEDLAEVLARRALTEDQARPDWVERRHVAGSRTARENIADLVDPDSFIEYGRFAIAAQRGRRDVQNLIERTAAAEDNAKALNAAVLFEIDDVIDPAETRVVVAATLAATQATDIAPRRRFVDTW